MGDSTREPAGNDWLLSVRQVWQADGLESLAEPPSWVVDRARRLYRQRGTDTAQATVLERIRGVLVLDTRRQTVLGVRAIAMPAAQAPGHWQLLFRCGDTDVDLHMRPSGDGRSISVRGQALALNLSTVLAGSVSVLARGAARAKVQTVASVPLASGGEFALPELAHGRYDFLLHLGLREIELSDVEL